MEFPNHLRVNYPWLPGNGLYIPTMRMTGGWFITVIFLGMANIPYQHIPTIYGDDCLGDGKHDIVIAT